MKLDVRTCCITRKFCLSNWHTFKDIHAEFSFLFYVAGSQCVDNKINICTFGWGKVFSFFIYKIFSEILLLCQANFVYSKKKFWDDSQLISERKVKQMNAFFLLLHEWKIRSEAERTIG